MQPPQNKPLSKAESAKILWHRGNLTWKLHPVQKELYDLYKSARYRTVVWNCGRRLGKSYTLCVLAIEECLRTPNAIVKFIAPNTKHVKRIIRPLMKQVLSDCPRELKPTFNTPDSLYKFPNGSEIQLAGTDNGHAESLRGGSSTLCVVDEAGFCDDLKYIVQSILIPTTTTTGGKVILCSTPPKSPDHDFIWYVKEAQYRGSYIKRTVYDNKMISQDIIDELERELGGKESIDFRREYLCEILVSEEYAVIPEFTAEVQAEIIKEWPKPVHYDGYVAGDIGFKDLTVFLFAYWDFQNAKLIIEDELVMSGQKMTTAKLAEQIKIKESQCFMDPVLREIKTPYLRVCDNNLIVINDLSKLHGLYCIPTKKDDKQAALNNLRLMIDAKEIIINPRCTTLIYHLQNAIWNKARKTYDRGPDGSHYDAVDAASYMVRNLNKARNPFPKGYGVPSSDNYFDPNANKKYEDTELNKNLRQIFAMRRSLGSRK